MNTQEIQKYIRKVSNPDVNESLIKENEELRNKLNNLIPLEKTQKEIAKKYIKSLDETNKLLKEKTEVIGYWNKHHKGTDRYKNIFSQMDALWHPDTYGTDNCSKCDKYRDILSHAFDKVEKMSNRDLNDFSKKHKKDINDKLDKYKEQYNHTEMELLKLEEKIEESRWINRIKKLFPYRIRITKY